MKRIQQQPILLFILLLIMGGLACQALSTAPATSTTQQVDTDAIVQQAVATIEAQLPVANTDPAITTSQAAPISTDLEAALIDIYRRVNPSVVHILVFDQLQDLDVPLGTGSGFVYDNEGHIITNNHVVADGQSFQVVFANGDVTRATVVGTDIDSDLAVIKADTLPEGIGPVTLGDSNSLQVGQFVAAIGNPFGEVGSMTIGIISGLGRSLPSQRVLEGGGRYTLPQVIQTDAAINPGNSGGPLLNLAGEVIGVNSAIRTTTGENSGVGFSIPVNAVKRIAPVLITEGKYVYPFMGIRMQSLDLSLQEALGLEHPFGAYILDVTPGSPADEAGLIGSGINQLTGEAEPDGDLILAIDGHQIKDSDDLISYLVFETEVGQTINLTVLRDGEEITVPLTLGERP